MTGFITFKEVAAGAQENASDRKLLLGSVQMVLVVDITDDSRICKISMDPHKIVTSQVSSSRALYDPFYEVYYHVSLKIARM